MKEYTLRETKHAKTRIAIVQAFIEALETSPYDEISIRQICKKVEISEGTFFNYFSEKLDLINYYTHLLFLKVIWRARQQSPQETPFIDFIESMFVKLAEEHRNFNVVYKMISVLLVQPGRPKRVEITDLERSIFLPGCPGIETIPVCLPDEFFMAAIEDAHRRGELPADLKANDLKLSLNTILIGTMLALKFEDKNAGAYHYRRQLQLLWKGLGIKRIVRKK